MSLSDHEFVCKNRFIHIKSKSKTKSSLKNTVCKYLKVFQKPGVFEADANSRIGDNEDAKVKSVGRLSVLYRFDFW